MPSIILNIDMKAASDGGRQKPFTEGYKPHLVAAEGAELMGVCAIDCPGWIYPGTKANVKFNLVYHPSVNYDALKIGANVEIREGNKVVGYGEITEYFAYP